MDRKQLWIITAVVTVIAWSVVMVAVGGSAALAALAPALGLTVQQIACAARPQATAASRHRVADVCDREKEGGAP